jgi:hypothetical protein
LRPQRLGGALLHPHLLNVLLGQHHRQRANDLLNRHALEVLLVFRAELGAGEIRLAQLLHHFGHLVRDDDFPAALLHLARGEAEHRKARRLQL